MTEHVMVPVPEQHVAAVEQYLNWGRKTKDPDPWTTEQLTTLYAAIDAPSRLMLEAVARELHRERVASIGQVAEEVGCSARELLGLVMEVNDTVRKSVEGQQFVVWPRQGPLESSTGPGIDTWVIAMADETGAVVRGLANTAASPD